MTTPRPKGTLPASGSNDDEELIRGRIDLLILYRNFEVATIATKPQQSNVLEALPQTLTEMMASPAQQFSLFGFLTNGRHFMFVKPLKQEQAIYGLSELFTLLRQGNELYQVASILRQVGERVMEQDWEEQRVG